MALFKFGAHEAQQWLEQESTEHRKALAAWRSGGYPDDSSGHHIEALVERSPPEMREPIRQYCETLTALVLAAEVALHQQAGVEHEVEVDATTELDRLDKLEDELGRTTLAALHEVLPFSRNDYWELSELRERLKKPQRGMRRR